MNNRFYIIPKTLAVYASNKLNDKNSPFKDNKFIVGLGKDNLKSTMNRVLKDLNTVLPNYNSIDSSRVTHYEISNSGLKFKIPNDLEIIEYHNNNYYGYNKICLELISSELPQGNYYTFVDVDIFLNIVRQGGNIIDNKLPGTYCVEILKETVNNVIIHLENPIDEEQAKAKEIGRLVAGSLTSDWEPGCLYAKKDGTFILYLGHLGKNYLKQGYGSLCFNVNNSIINNSNKHYLSDGNDLCIFINSNADAANWRGRDLKEILTNILTGNVIDSIRTDLKKGTGAKLGEFLIKDEDFNANQYIRNYCLDSIKDTKIEDFTPLQQYHLLFLSDKIQELKKEILQNERKICIKETLPILKEKINSLGNDKAISWLKEVIKKAGNIHWRSSYNYYDFKVGNSEVFDKKDLEENINLFLSELLKEAGITL